MQISNLDGGQSDFIAPALLHALEDFPLKTLDLTTLFGSSVRLPEEACTQVCYSSTSTTSCVRLTYQQHFF